MSVEGVYHISRTCSLIPTKRLNTMARWPPSTLKRLLLAAHVSVVPPTSSPTTLLMVLAGGSLMFFRLFMASVLALSCLLHSLRLHSQADALCLYVGAGVAKRPDSAKQVVAESSQQQLERCPLTGRHNARCWVRVAEVLKRGMAEARREGGKSSEPPRERKPKEPKERRRY